MRNTENSSFRKINLENKDNHSQIDQILVKVLKKIRKNRTLKNCVNIGKSFYINNLNDREYKNKK